MIFALEVFSGQIKIFSVKQIVYVVERNWEKGKRDGIPMEVEDC